MWRRGALRQLGGRIRRPSQRRLLGLERGTGDGPGGEVPERYRDFVATGNWKWLAPVVDHNRRDLVAMAVLLARLCELEPGFLKDVQSAD